MTESICVYADAGDDGQLYNNVTLYVLGEGQEWYDTVPKHRTTRKQLEGIWDKLGYVFVASVDRKPAQLLTTGSSINFTDMGSVHLQDDAHLAVVIHKPLTFMEQLEKKVVENSNLVSHL